MTVEIIDGLKVLTPSEGHFLHCENVYAEYQVFMSPSADHSAWEEVDSIPDPPAEDPEISDSEALDIIVNGNETE